MIRARFSDRLFSNCYRPLKLAAAALLLCGSLNYAAKAGPRRFPNLGRMLAEPAAFEGRTTWLQARVVEVEPGRWRAQDDHGYRVWVQPAPEGARPGDYTVLRGRFRAAGPSLEPDPGALRVITHFGWRRAGNYLISLVALLGLAVFLRRTFGPALERLRHA